MASASREYTIFAGTPAEASSAVTLISLGSPATVGTPRRLVYPTTDLLPITYFRNPDRTSNFDRDTIAHPRSRVFMALEGSSVLRFETDLRDVVVVEEWTGSATRASMPTFFARQLMEYLLSPPAFSQSDPQYIQWEPADRTTSVYNVEFVGLNIGGRTAEGQEITIRDFGAETIGSTIAGPLDALSVNPSGLEIENVALAFKIISKVS